MRELLIRQLQALIDETIEEFNAEELDIDDDTIVSAELTLGDINLIINALRKYK